MFTPAERYIVLLLALSSHSFPQTADSIREFLNGDRVTFNTQDHPKAKGAHFTIAYPRSWVAKEGDRPNVVQKFVSAGGRGLEMAMIITKALPLPSGAAIPEAELTEFFTPSEMKDMLPTGAKFIDAKQTNPRSAIISSRCDSSADKRRLSTADGCDRRLQRFRVVHPFHPLYGQEFEQLGGREGLPEDRLYFEDRDGRAASIPKRFTDHASVDPVVVMGKGQCLFRIVDLVELCSLIEASRLA